MKKWTNTNTKRRLLSLALSIVMVLSLLPAGALAEDPVLDEPVQEGLVQEQPVQEEPEKEEPEQKQEQQQEPVQEPKTETCTHSNDPAVCEACASEARVAAVQAQIDALPGDVTAETKEAAQSALSAVDTAKSALTEPEQAQLNMTRYTALTQKLAALESPAPSATGDTTEKTAKVISAWAWIDEEEYLDEETGGLALPGASEEMPAYFVDVVTFLPYEITATVDGVEETLTIDWVCDNYPEDGAYEGEYTFTATLPEGYALDEGVKALTVPVLLGGIKRYATEISYMTWSDSLKKLVPAECSNATEVTGSESDTAITWGESGETTWYVVNSNLTIGQNDTSGTNNGLDAVIQVLGNVHLILADGCSLTVYGRIEVNDDKYGLTAGSGTLTIYGQSAGTGKLTVNSPTWERDCCAIGGKFANKLVDDVNHIYNYNDGGAITINGGIIKATFRGKYNGAAIGGPAGGTSTVTINGGVVTAVNNDEGAGIGGGSGAATITINGGTITASASKGAGIGNKATSGETNITINGGTVTASSSKGAGIGSGESSKGSVAVTINGGKVTAKSTTGAAIGNGKAGTGIATVIINGGTIDASTTNKLGNVTQYGAAIGCGVDSGKTSVTINNCTKVTARGGESAPGIGSTTNTRGTVTIKGGTVEAYGGHQAAGIGGANHHNSCTVLIEGGNVKAQGGGLAAGIGTGDGNGQTQGAITISGGTVSAIGGKWAAGIGGGNGNVAGTINISGGTVIVTRDGTDSEAVAHTAMDVGDGANSDANKDAYTRFTLSGSAKLYLQHDYLVTEHTNITSGYIFKQFETKPEDYSVVQVFGEQTLSENFCIDTGKTMIVMSGASLSTGSNKLYVKGTLTRTGTASGNIYYPLTLTNCTADSSNTSTYGDSNELFGKADATISLTHALEGGYKFDSWTVTPNTVNVSNNRFTMPQHATTVEAKGTQVLWITQQPEPTTIIIYGDKAILSVTAQNSSGETDGITYQWYKGTEKLPNETSKTLSLRYLDASTQPYSFYCEVSCNGVSINSNTATVTVNKAQASVTIDSDPSKTYDGTPVDTPSYTVSGSGFPKIEYKLQSEPADNAYTTTAPTDAGSYTVRVTMSENQNYKGASATKDFTISKATDNAWQTEPSVTNFTYGDTVTNPVTYEAKYGNGNVVVTYKKQGTEGDPSTTVPTDAGIYDVKVTLEETNNYGPKLEATNLTLTIAKAASSVTTAPTDAQSLYSGSTVSLVTEGTPAGGTMHYSLDGETWSAEIPTATDCGKYTVYYKVVGDNNHTDTEAQTLTAEIVPFKIQTQPQPVTIDYGNDAEMSVTLDTILSDITYQWYQLTDEGDVELTDATESTMTLTKPIAGEYTYVCKITCGEYSATSAEAVVTVNAVSQPLPTADLPDGLWAEGGEEPLNGDSIDLKSPSSRLLTKYTEGKNTQGDPYPAGMQIYSVEKDDQGQTVVVPVAELDNLLQYSGCSIRINGKPGIRMITSLTKQAKAALKKGKLAGYTLEEYGTVVAWSKELGDNPLTLSTGSSNYAYRKGVSDPVFANVGDRTQYTNVLVWDSLPDEKYAMDIVMRPYIILSKDGETVTLYGGTVSRSIGYVAQQNADTFPKGSAGYKYVHDIIDKVNKLTEQSQPS